MINFNTFATHCLVYVPYTSIPISSFYDINLRWFQAKNWQCMKPPFDVMQSFILKWGMVLVFFKVENIVLLCNLSKSFEEI